MTIKNETEEEKKLRGLIGFLSANKIDSCSKRGGKKKKNPKESAEQVKT